jgi:2-oxoglutarate dehydrogenase E2 component (dihydrolipoamide succinyltransferase)
MPQLGETVTEGTVAAWHKKVGDLVQTDEMLLDVETDKVATEITAPIAGVVSDILVGAGETVEVGTVLAVIEDGEAADDTQPAEAAASSAQQCDEAPAAAKAGNAMAASNSDAASGKVSPRSGNDTGPPLSPAVRRLLSDHGIAPDAISGTGKDGRLTKSDVLEWIASSGQEAQSTRPESDRTDMVKKFSRIRKITAERMVQSKASSPHVLQAVEVDFTAVARVRDRVKSEWKEQYGYSLTFLPFISAGVCQTLRAFPDLNSSVQDDGLLVHRAVNLAIAVDLGSEGLVAPVIPAAGDLSVQELAHAIRRISASARSGKLQSDQLSGGTYTISNSGTFGTMITAPIINQPQVAILSVDGIRKRPVVVESAGGDAIAIRQVGVLAHSFDHRAVDGAYSAAFLSALRQRLETHDWSAGF